MVKICDTHLLIQHTPSTKVIVMENQEQINVNVSEQPDIKRLPLSCSATLMKQKQNLVDAQKQWHKN